ncbi:MAG: hypothetical protein WCY01_09570 [Alkalispirochaeta sp.]|jgi:hypothetical protein
MTLRNVVAHDYLVSAFLLSPFALWAAVIIRNIGGHDIAIWVGIALAGTVVLCTLGLKRGFAVLNILRNGTETVGTIVAVMIQGQRGRIEFTFLHAEEKITVNLAVRKCTVLKEMKQGTRVRVRYDNNRPALAVLPVVFEEK